MFRFVAAAYERRSPGVASHWPFNEWGHFLPDQTTAVSLIDRLLSRYRDNGRYSERRIMPS